MNSENDLLHKAQWWHLNPTPIAKTKREVHLETLLILALPYIEREELSTRTCEYTRWLLAEIKGQVEKGA